MITGLLSSLSYSPALLSALGVEYWVLSFGPLRMLEDVLADVLLSFLHSLSRLLHWKVSVRALHLSRTRMTSYEALPL